MKLRRWGRLLVLATLAVMTLTGASWPLQPLVEVKTSRTSAVPPGCDGQSLAPAPAPRLEVKQLPPPEQIITVALAEPPSRSLRSELEAAHRALANNDRPAFDEHLRNTRAVLSGYPPGGERTAAEEVVRVLDDASRVWDAQFESPFFDEQSDVYARLSRYSGYTDAVRRSMLTDDADRRYYPAGESREFLTRVAADRLPRLGVRTETRVARAEPRYTEPRETPRETPRVSPSPRKSSTPRKSTTAVPKQAERTTMRPRSYTPSRSSSRTKISRKAPTVPRSMPTAPDRPSAAQTATETSSRTPARVAAPRTAVTAPPPTPAAPITQTVATAPTPAATKNTAPVVTETTAPEVTQTTATEATTPERRSIVVPAILIFIGLGVLILLFRAAN